LLQLEACVEPVTCKLTLEEELLPGEGLMTLMAYVPAEEAAPVAVSCVAETNVVGNGVAPKSTCAPLTNLLPVTVSEKLPVPTLAGLMPVNTGVGFRSVTLLGPLADESAALVARTVTVLGCGRTTGAVKLPVVLIVPRAEEPPVVPLTDQVTAWFVVPDTAAVNVNESPARIFAVEGDTTTVIEGGGGGGLVFVPRVVAEQPAATSIAKKLPSWNNLRISEGTHQEPLKTGCSLGYWEARGYWTKGQKWADVRVR